MTEFSALYQKYAADVFRFALYLSGNRDEAEDLVSTTFIRVWTSPEPVRMATVKGYLFTIARNLFLQGLRRTRRQASLDETLPDLAPGPAESVEKKAELEATLAAMQRLPEVDRAALLMRALEEMPYDEIARSLGISLSAAKVKVHRARRMLLDLRDSDFRPESAPGNADAPRPAASREAGAGRAGPADRPGTGQGAGPATGKESS